MSSRPAGSRPLVGSSSSTSSGSPTIACASFVRCRIPVENSPIGRKRASSSPTRSRMSDARWRAARAGKPAQLAERRDHVGGGLIERQAIVLRACSRAATAPDRIAGHVEAAHLDVALRRVGEAEEEAKRRRLAGTVGTDQADAPAWQLDAQAIERRGARISLGESVDAEKRTGEHDHESLPRRVDDLERDDEAASRCLRVRARGEPRWHPPAQRFGPPAA